MSYITEIFSRLDIQHIREFLLRGSECAETDPKGYKERIDEALGQVGNLIKRKYPDNDEYTEVMNAVFMYAGVCEDVHMEIGLQCGFMLAMQVSSNMNPKNK